MNKSYAFIAIDSASERAVFVFLVLVVFFALVFAFLVVASTSTTWGVSVVCVSIVSASTRARSFALYFRLRGFVLNLYPQQGHQRPSHLMNISQI